MGNSLDPVTGKPIYTDTSQTQADLQASADFAEKVGNRRRGTATERGAVTGPVGLEWYETDTGATWVLTAGGWARRQLTLLGRSRSTALAIVAAAPSWTDIASVVATSSGGTCAADFAAIAYNSASGANRTAAFRIVCDGVQVEDTFPLDVVLSGGTTGVGISGEVESTPGAGSHTWKLQANASTSNAIGVRLGATLKITEL